MTIDERREYARQYYLAHRAEILERNKAHNRLHKVVRTKHYWEYRAQMKLDILKHYGNGICVCVNCGFTDVRALSI